MKKVDKGFELFYYNLSHRRRFIRTIWIALLGIPMVDFMFYLVRRVPPHIYYSWKSIIIVNIVLIIIGAIQAIYEYKKWKAEVYD